MIGSNLGNFDVKARIEELTITFNENIDLANSLYGKYEDTKDTSILLQASEYCVLARKSLELMESIQSENTGLPGFYSQRLVEQRYNLSFIFNKISSDLYPKDTSMNMLEDFEDNEGVGDIGVSQKIVPSSTQVNSAANLFSEFNDVKIDYEKIVLELDYLVSLRLSDFSTKYSKNISERFVRCDDAASAIKKKLLSIDDQLLQVLKVVNFSIQELVINNPHNIDELQRLRDTKSQIEIFRSTVAESQIKLAEWRIKIINDNKKNVTQLMYAQLSLSQTDILLNRRKIQNRFATTDDVINIDIYKKQYEMLLHVASLLARQAARDYCQEYESLTEGFWSEADLDVQLALPTRWKTSNKEDRDEINYREFDNRELRLDNDKKWVSEKIHKGEFHHYLRNNEKYSVPKEKRQGIFKATVNAMCASEMMSILRPQGKAPSTVVEYKSAVQDAVATFNNKNDLHELRVHKKLKNKHKQSEEKSYKEYMVEQKANPIVAFFEIAFYVVSSMLNLGSGLAYDLMVECKKTRGHCRFWDKVTDDVVNTVNEVEELNNTLKVSI